MDLSILFDIFGHDITIQKSDNSTIELRATIEDKEESIYKPIDNTYETEWKKEIKIQPIDREKVEKEDTIIIIDGIPEEDPFVIKDIRGDGYINGEYSAYLLIVENSSPIVVKRQGVNR
jgi:hypothetical protein